MIAEGITKDLLFIAFFIWLISTIVLSRVLPFLSACLVAFIKVCIPVIYFAKFSDGSWIHIDDQAYIEEGLKVLYQGCNPLLTFLRLDHGYEALLIQVGGRHIIYSWWNLLSFWLFSEDYFAPVFMNVGLTSIAAYFFVQILKLSDFPTRYQKWLCVFFILHWDIISWSSFTNLKEMMVMTFTIFNFWILLYAITKKSNKQFLWILLWGLSLYVFFWLRFYIPVLIIISIMVWILIGGYIKQFLLLAIPSAIVCIFFLSTDTNHVLSFLDFSNLIYGPIRSFLTPQPWNIEEAYSYITIASFLHWLFAIPAIIGGVLLWNQFPNIRLLLIYFIVTLALYAFFPGQQGPRHRVQISFVLVLAQYHFLWTFFHGKVTQRAKNDEPPSKYHYSQESNEHKTLPA